MKTFFTSDTHFGHDKIITYCGRPFADVGQMNKGLATRWNALVGPHDRVYHLGDFALGPHARWADYRSMLNGRITLVRGNHDGSAEVMRSIGMDDVASNLIVEIEGTRCWLSHLPPADIGYSGYAGRRCVRPAAPGAYDIALCGQVHRKWKVRGGVVNVGVDVWAYRPIRLSEILQSLRESLPTRDLPAGS